MSWSRGEIPGGAIELFEPSTAEPSIGLLFLPGHSGTTLNNNTTWTQALERAGLRAACPVAGSGWWLDDSDPIANRTPLQWLHQVVAGWLKTEWDTRPGGLAVSGVSLGAQAALGLAYRHARDYPVVAAVAPAVDFHKLHGLGLPLDDWYNSSEDARQHTVPLHINPLDWPVHQMLCCDSDDHEWFDGVQRLTGKLHSSGIPVTTLFESHQLGHCWDYFNTAANHVVDFVTQRLQQVHKSL